jgi:hypothetical protein
MMVAELSSKWSHVAGGRQFLGMALSLFGPASACSGYTVPTTSTRPEIDRGSFERLHVPARPLGAVPGAGDGPGVGVIRAAYALERAGLP